MHYRHLLPSPVLHTLNGSNHHIIHLGTLLQNQSRSAANMLRTSLSQRRVSIGTRQKTKRGVLIVRILMLFDEKTVCDDRKDSTIMAGLWSRLTDLRVTMLRIVHPLRAGSLLLLEDIRRLNSSIFLLSRRLIHLLLQLKAVTILEGGNATMLCLLVGPTNLVDLLRLS